MRISNTCHRPLTPAWRREPVRVEVEIDIARESAAFGPVERDQLASGRTGSDADAVVEARRAQARVAFSWRKPEVRRAAIHEEQPVEAEERIVEERLVAER